MDSSSTEQRSARMRHLHEDDSLVFPRRPVENLSLDVDSARHARVFADDVMSGGDGDMCAATRTSQTKARFMVIGSFCCFLFLLVTVSIYSSLNEQNSLDIRGMSDDVDGSQFDGLTGEGDEIIDDTLLDSLENQGGTGSDIVPGDVTEGGDTMTPVLNVFGEYDDDVIIPEIEPVNDLNQQGEDGVVDKGDSLDEMTKDGINKDLFIMDVNGIRFEIGIGTDGDFDLPEGLILNPHVRQHWSLIQNTLGLDDYDEDTEGNGAAAGEDGELILEAPITSEKDGDKIDQDAPDAKAGKMPEGLLFDPPPATDEHVHGEGCDPVAVDVNDETDDSIADEKASETDDLK
uniref:uncharacterized protein LOC120347670 isoform X1 n=1 Tax=Styela clava TaxID=7725 RepID=UPI00193A7599|nr:uncharacterized protein LOC120347670 isoform X1 [Styela clava]